MKPNPRKRPNRAGYAAVLFVMMFFGMMGLAALVIDMGFARLAQRQMQTAVDSAALEGLRWRDVQQSADLPQAWLANSDFQAQTGVVPGGDQLNAQQRETVRRWAAGNVAGSLFTDYVDSGGGTVHYGAGPVVSFSVDTTGLAALQSMQPGTPPVYQPGGLQLNTDNAPEGDMLAGTYNPGQSSAEGNDYARADFTPAPSGSSTVGAFLVRMRRTINNTGNSSSNTSNLDQEDGISSAGLTLPVLFGRGSVMARNGDTGSLSAASGITVRATAIAAAMPAKSVGPAYSTATGTSVAQVAPFAITNDLWAQLSSGTTMTVPLPDPRVLLLTPASCASLTAIGQRLAVTSDDSALLAGDGNAIYVPIYANLPSQSATIVGFVYYPQSRWTYSNSTLTLTPPANTSYVGSQNVSGTIALPLPSSLTQQDITSLLQDHAGLTNPLYAPVLVNHYIGPQP